MTCPTMLILSPEVIDKNFISPNFNESLHSTDEWRDLFAQRIGFKSFSEMSVRVAVLLDARMLYGFVDNVDATMWRLSTWYVPQSPRGELYLPIESYPDDPEYYVSVWLEEYESSPWAKNTTFLKLGKVCITKDDAKEMRSDYSEKLESCGIEELDSPASEYAAKFVERGHPYEFWSNLFGQGRKDRETLLKCRSLPKLYAAICDYLGSDGEDVCARFGFSIEEFVEEILDDENCVLNENYEEQT